ncbi:MAG: hypothetical protein ACTSYD_07530 [Candidatus Heimdallarchaeaceae archaeon]
MNSAVRQTVGLVLGLLFFFGGIILIISNAVEGGSQLRSDYLGPMLVGVLLGIFGIAIIIVTELEDLKAVIIETRK